jgi:hypothetical protein
MNDVGGNGSQVQGSVVKLEEDLSSFAVVGRGGLPVEPIRFMPSFGADGKE